MTEDSEKYPFSELEHLFHSGGLQDIGLRISSQPTCCTWVVFWSLAQGSENNHRKRARGDLVHRTASNRAAQLRRVDTASSGATRTPDGAEGLPQAGLQSASCDTLLRSQCRRGGPAGVLWAWKRRTSCDVASTTTTVGTPLPRVQWATGPCFRDQRGRPRSVFY